MFICSPVGPTSRCVSTDILGRRATPSGIQFSYGIVTLCWQHHVPYKELVGCLQAHRWVGRKGCPVRIGSKLREAMRAGTKVEQEFERVAAHERGAENIVGCCDGRGCDPEHTGMGRGRSNAAAGTAGVTNGHDTTNCRRRHERSVRRIEPLLLRREPSSRRYSAASGRDRAIARWCRTSRATAFATS